MFFENIEIDYFNLIEGIFWVGLGMVVLFIYSRLEKTYQVIALFAAFILVTFGISDFIQVAYGSFLVEGMEWLFIWKVIDVIGLCIVVLWYLILRIRK